MHTSSDARRCQNAPTPRSPRDVPPQHVELGATRTCDQSGVAALITPRGSRVRATIAGAATDGLAAHEVVCTIGVGVSTRRDRRTRLSARPCAHPSHARTPHQPRPPYIDTPLSTSSILKLADARSRTASHHARCRILELSLSNAALCCGRHRRASGRRELPQKIERRPRWTETEGRAARQHQRRR
jgi:hypothetical protein